MKKIIEKIEILKLNAKKELLKLVLINLFFIILVILITLFYKNIIFLSLILIGAVIFNYLFVSRYSKMIKDKKIKKDESFIELFSYLKIYLYNGETVYQALNQVIVFSNDEIKDDLKNLIDQIDDDKTIKPYMDFASKFNDKSIEEVMISIYEITNCGNNELYLNQFNKVFEELHSRIENDKQYKKIKFLENLNIFSIVGSGMIMVILSFCVISLLGGMING